MTALQLRSGEHIGRAEAMDVPQLPLPLFGHIWHYLPQNAYRAAEVVHGDLHRAERQEIALFASDEAGIEDQPRMLLAHGSPHPRGHA